MKKTRSKWFYAILILFSVFFIASCAVGFAACGGGDDDEDDDQGDMQTATVTNVTVSPASLEFTVGDAAKSVTATVTMSSGSYSGSYSWSSSDNDVATVSGSGATATVTAVAEGTATITVAVSDGKSASCSVKVNAASTEPEEPEPDTPYVTAVTLDSTSLSLSYQGSSSTLSVTSVTMSDGGNYDGGFAWSVSPENIVTVTADTTDSSKATVAPLAVGSATITVTAGSASATCSVTVSAVAIGVSLDKDTLSLVAEGSTGSLTATVTMNDGSSYSGDYDWSSSNTTVATVAGGTRSTNKNTGTVTPLSAGTATITVKVGDQSASCTVTVSEPVISGVSLSDGALHLGLNASTDGGDQSVTGAESATLEASVNLNNGKTDDTAEVVWTVEDDVDNGTSPASIATGSSSAVVTIVAVDDNPNAITVTALAEGSATITATVTVDENTTYSDSCVVTVYDHMVSFEAEDAALFNSADSGMGDTEILGTENSSSFEGVTQVKNFNVKGDKIVFQLDASAAISDVTIDAIVTPTNDDFDASEHNGFISVNGVAVSATGKVAKSAYGAVTAKASLEVGINYVEITLDVSGSSLFGMNLGYMNVDRIVLDWDGEATVDMIETGGSVASVSAGAANTLAISDAYLMNAKGSYTTGNLMAYDTATDSDGNVTVNGIKNITAGDEVVYQLNSDAAVSAILSVTLGTGNNASNLTVKVNGKEVTADATDGAYTVSLSKGVNYIELVGADGLPSGSSLSLSAATLATVAAGVEEARVSAAKEGDSDFAVGDVTFTDSRITVTYDPETRTYTLDGMSAKLSAAQLAALELNGEGDDHEGCEYIAFKVVANVGETVKITNCNGTEPTEGKEWVLYGTEDATHQSTTDGAFVLDTTDHINGAFSMVLEITDANGVTMTYTIVLGTIERSVEEGRVSATEKNSDDLAVDEGLSFEAADVTVTYDPETKTYTISGTSNVFGEELAKAFWGETDGPAHAECEYITFTIVANPGETIKITTYNGDAVEKTGVMYGADTADLAVKGGVADGLDGTFVLDTTNHTDGDWKMVLEVEYANGDKVTYTVVLGTIERAHQEAEGSRVDAPKAGDDDFSATVEDETGEEVTVTFTDCDVTVSYDPVTRTYTIEGVSAKYSADQLAALQLDGDEAHTDCWYVSFKVTANAGETITIKTYNGDTPEKTWVLYGDETAGTSTTDGAFILDTTNHTCGDWKMVLEVEYANGDKVTYTIVLGDIQTYCEAYGHIARDYGDGELYAMYIDPDKTGTSGWYYLCETCGEWIAIESCDEDCDVYDFVLVADDETSLDAAIATAKARSEENKVTKILVYGTIEISDEGIVTIDCSNVEIYGLGADKSKIVDSGYDANEHSGLAKSGVEIKGENVTIRDLTIDGTALNGLASTVQYSHAVEILDGAKDVTLKNLVIVGGGNGNNDAAVCILTAAGDVSIVSCELSGAHNGVDIEHTGANSDTPITVTISGGTIDGRGGIFISGDTSGNVTLSVEGATVNGKNSLTNNSTVTFTDCTFGYFVDGEKAYGSVGTYTDVTFVNCKFLSHEAGTTNDDAIYKNSLNYVIRPRQESITLTFIDCKFENTHTDLDAGTLAVDMDTFIYIVSGKSDVTDCYLYFDDSEGALRYVFDVTAGTVEHDHTWEKISTDYTTGVSSYVCYGCGATKTEVTETHVESVAFEKKYAIVTTDEAETFSGLGFTITMSDGVPDGDNATTYTSIADYLAAYRGDTVTWTSSDETVATVDSDGKVAIVGTGYATITVEFYVTGVAASYTLYVGEPTGEDDPILGSWSGSYKVAVEIEGDEASFSVTVTLEADEENGLTLKASANALLGTITFEETVWTDAEWYKVGSEYFVVLAAEDEEGNEVRELAVVSYDEESGQMSLSFEFSFSYGEEEVEVDVSVEGVALEKVEDEADD